jgi:hypothetical protein
MSRFLPELENLLQLLVAEHRKLLAQLDGQQAAMRAFDLKAMDDLRNQQEASRLRIGGLEAKRKALVLQIGRGLKVEGNLTLGKLADLHPPRRAALLKLREELRDVAEAIGTRTHVAGRLAGAVLGHLNTVVRLLAGAVERAGVYTKHGVPQVSSRIGVMDAVG